MWIPTNNKHENEVLLKIETLKFEISQVEYKIKSTFEQNRVIQHQINEVEMAIDNCKGAHIVSVVELEAMKGNVLFFKAMLRRNGDILIEQNKRLDFLNSELEDYELILKCKVISLEGYRNAKKSST